MNLIDFFDPNNIEHIIAYCYLRHRGSWTEDFWEKIKDMEIPTGWSYLLTSKMADCWVSYKIQREDYLEEEFKKLRDKLGV